MRNHVMGGLAVVLAAAAAPADAQAVAHTVNCSNPVQTISGALDAGFDKITVVGTCTETVQIRRDDVTIEGTGGATLLGKVIIDGAGRVKIKNLKIQGSPDTGVLLTRGASVVLDGVTVNGAGEDGVKATGNSYLEVVNGSVVENNLAGGIIIEQGSGALVADSTCRNNQFDGLAVQGGGAAQLRGNTFEHNGPDGDSEVFIADNSFARLTGNTITAHEPAEALTLRSGVARLAGGNTISGEGFATIDLFLGATLHQRNGHDIVNGPVQIKHSSNAEFRGDVDINGDMNIDNHSVVNLRSAKVTGSIALARDSGLSMVGPASVSGSVDCADEESSFSSTEDSPNVGGGVSCSGF